MKFRQPLTGAAKALYEYSTTIPTIDTHEHIPRCEADYNATTITFANLFNPYVSNDLNSAGMPFPEGVWPAFHCIGDDWDAFEPHWNAVKHGSYARPIRIALQEFYGVDDFTRENYLEIVRRINENNTPGIYHRILREKCGIEKAIRCAGDLPDRGDPIVVGNISSPSLQVTSRETIQAMADAIGAGMPESLDALIEVGDAWMDLQAKNGAIVFKSASMPDAGPDRDTAEDLLACVLAGETLTDEESVPLRVLVREANARKCAELDIPLALHTGVWNDFHLVDVNHIVGLVQRNPATRFDVYHLGIPEPRAAIQLVKNFPNAYLNLCWAHVVASDMVVNTLAEAIDMVPMNKVFAFGADYVLFIEKVYGHLLMARENIAIALGNRVDRQLMDLDEAKEILKGWFCDGPKEFYGL